MASESAPPPIYSQEYLAPAIAGSDDSNDAAQGPQLLIIPTVDAINFQKGYLGADGERAAIEGELQIKGTVPERWAKVTVSLRTVEKAYHQEIELSSTEIVLFSSFQSPGVTMPSTLPFAIPLTPDTPQSIRTPRSSLSHTLAATMHSSDPFTPALSESLAVQTRRFTSHAYAPVIHPETHILDDPTRVEVEVPRTTYKAAEPIPIYVTIPPPRRELVVEHGLRLRNVRAELVRVVRVKGLDGDDDTLDFKADFASDSEEHYEVHPSTSNVPSSSVAFEKRSQAASSSKDPEVGPLVGISYRTVVAHSGASCRFHSSLPIRLRFVLHPPSPSGSPSDFPVDLPTGEYSHHENDTECAPITQTTLLHSVTFQLKIRVSFVDMSCHVERFSTMSIPIVIIAPPATLPEVEEWVDAAYQKKHDRPPVKTIRQEDVDSSAPHYEGVAGPSVNGGAPPPFEERDAPPPFFSHAAESSTSGGLPTFLESEAEIIVPHRDEQSTVQPLRSRSSIEGEGTEFGFPSAQQFDGHSEVMQRSSSPPPTLEMATRDTDVTGLADIHEPGQAMEALGLALEQHDEATGDVRPPPPPPPAMDDPSDPPPSIDSEFRSPTVSQQQLPPHSSSPRPQSSFGQSTESTALPSSPPTNVQDHSSSHGHAPPPYLIPENIGEQEHVARPPPYVG